ncbi:hypothetical protein DEF23_08315 [Marinitenerispora sediminis]|uniref:Uncharacterized protein n=1 Tax=Marinitenerispora sediminis TaxID=1931232 RepID=A0A368T9M7_9ACTN|nr:hypothetical protein DEF28_00160 [Marinitenerispora sediminis]RCV58750.1 hypothetical protein DEF23_08315 [Marinitenerispora sediminis]RCV61401.1 hypothetical protein DEF24_04430 [Marinitenerispora sediminis]
MESATTPPSASSPSSTRSAPERQRAERKAHYTQGSSELPPTGLHGLRHGAASLSLAAGVDVKVVSGSRLVSDVFPGW